MGSPSIFNGAYVKLLKNALRLGSLSSAPASPAAGDLYYDSTDTALKYHNGTGFQTVTSGANIDSPVWAENYTLSTSVGSNALTIALKTKAGTDPSSTDPVKVAFRNATSATGNYTVLTITSALSITVSAGSTLGMISGNSSTIWVYLFNDAGTPRLGVSQSLFSEKIPRSSTAEGGAGAADSNRVIYTGTAVTTKAFRVLACMLGSNVAGNWTAVPTIVSLNPVMQQSFFARYKTGAGNSISNNTNTVIDFGSRDFDSCNCVTTGASWVYTVPVTGDYFVSSQIVFDNGAGWDAGERIELSIRLNTTVQAIGYEEAQTTHSSRKGQGVFCVVRATAGDTIDIMVNQNTGASRALLNSANYNHVTIFKINSEIGDFL